jgi:hypothetical protein
MIAVAVNNGWEIPPAVRTALPNALAVLALDPRQKKRTRLSAARILVSMAQQDAPSTPSQVNVGVVVTVGDHIRALLGEPDYLDFLRQQEGGDSGVVCAES